MLSIAVGWMTVIHLVSANAVDWIWQSSYGNEAAFELHITQMRDLLQNVLITTIRTFPLFSMKTL
jgi:hypothetical protein